MTYKPGWVFEARVDDSYWPAVVLDGFYRMPSSNDPTGPPIKLYRREIVNDMTLANIDFDWSMESHERDEWLKVGGKRLKEPHR